MNIHIENISKKTKGEGTYFTFALTYEEDAFHIRTSGWRYFPSTGTISAPAREAAKGRYVPVVWLGGFTYDQTKEHVQDYFVNHGFCEVPWELPTEKVESPAPPKHPKTETSEQRNRRLLDKQGRKVK